MKLKSHHGNLVIRFGVPPEEVVEEMKMSSLMYGGADSYMESFVRAIKDLDDIKRGEEAVDWLITNVSTAIEWQPPDPAE